jgi:hypothetical protein
MVWEAAADRVSVVRVVIRRGGGVEDDRIVPGVSALSGEKSAEH